MPVYDCGARDCEECQRAFGPDRSAAIANYEARERHYAALDRRHKDQGGSIGMNGECLVCTAEAGVSCR